MHWQHAGCPINWKEFRRVTPFAPQNQKSPVAESELSQWIESLLGPNIDPVAAGTTLQRIGALSPDHLPDLIDSLASHHQLLSQSDPAILGALMLAVQQLAAKDIALSTASPGRETTDSTSQTETASSQQDNRVEKRPAETHRLIELDVNTVAAIADALPEQTPNRHRLLYLLAANRTPAAIQTLAEQLSTKPPLQWTEVGQVLSPLMQHDDWEPEQLYPNVLAGLVHPSVAAPILDLANYLYRTGQTTVHPAESRRDSLVVLLGGVVGRLSKFEEDPRSMGDSVETIQTVLAEAVALAVSLCDALGLNGWEGASGKLYQAMELRHRRVQCEAAGALARLGIEEGRKRLIELAAEPSARLRVIAYAEELGFDAEIDDAHKTNEAKAEADLALWLSQPANMGVPPTHIEVIDQRQLYWPSFDQPVDCYLVRFEYQFGDRVYSNIGIAGPTVFTVGTDLADLPHDDIYAVYAGWQAEHDEIFTIAASNWNSAQKRLSAPLIDTLDRQGFESIQPRMLCFFLDEHAMVAEATRHDTQCIVITDGLETIDFSTQGRLRPMTADDLWYLFLGRRMLRTFNS